MRTKIYTQKVNFYNNTFSGMTALISILILISSFLCIPEVKAENPPLSIQVEHVTCHGINDGRIEISPSEKISGSYKIDVVSKLSGVIGTFNEKSLFPVHLANLKTGNYIIWYSDGKNKESMPVVIEGPDALKANIISIESVNGVNEALRATIKANPSGGTPPYTITWSENTGNKTGAIISNLPMGVYRCTINDANRCGEVTATIFLYETEIKKFKETTK